MEYFLDILHVQVHVSTSSIPPNFYIHKICTVHICIYICCMYTSNTSLCIYIYAYIWMPAWNSLCIDELRSNGICGIHAASLFLWPGRMQWVSIWHLDFGCACSHQISPGNCWNFARFRASGRTMGLGENILSVLRLSKSFCVSNHMKGSLVRYVLYIFLNKPLVFWTPHVFKRSLLLVSHAGCGRRSAAFQSVQLWFSDGRWFQRLECLEGCDGRTKASLDSKRGSRNGKGPREIQDKPRYAWKLPMVSKRNMRNHNFSARYLYVSSFQVLKQFCFAI